MSSIVENLLKESSNSALDSRSLKNMNMKYLLEADEPGDAKVDTAMQKSAKALKALSSTLGDMKQTAALVTKAGANMTNAVASGENDEEALALFSLSSQFGASLLSLLSSVQRSLETEEDTAGKSVVSFLGGEAELKKIIEKTFKPSTTSLALIQKANDMIAKAKDITATGASSEGDEPEGRTEPDSIFEIEDVKDIDEGLFSNIGNFLKGLFKKVPADAKGTIKSLMPLFGGANIAKALLADLSDESMTGEKFTGLLSEIKPSLEQLAPGTETVGASGGGGGGGGGASGGGASGGGASGGGASGGGASGGGGSSGAGGGGRASGGSSDAAGDDEESGGTLSSMLFQAKSKNFRSKAKLPEKAGKVRQAFEELGIIKPDDTTGNKQEIIDKAKKILNASNALKGIKLESTSNENEAIIERWQRLAGLKD